MGTYLTSKLCKLSSEYPTFEYDLEKEMMMKRVALQKHQIFRDCRAETIIQLFLLCWI